MPAFHKGRRSQCADPPWSELYIRDRRILTVIGVCGAAALDRMFQLDDHVHGWC